ncbi:MAG: hypothetical protein L0H93_18140 [Nocardioides sp.]|nr:hypothetical protein [Nocardioides sp.]
MDLSIRQGIFTSLASVPGAESCLLMFDDGRPVLHLDMGHDEWMTLLMRRSIEGRTREGSDFTAVLDGSFFTNGRITVALDDLLVSNPYERPDETFDSRHVRTLELALDPQAVGEFFVRDEHDLDHLRTEELIGRRIDDLVDLYDPVSMRCHGRSTTLTLSAAYSVAASAIDGFSGRNRMRLRLRWESESTIDLDTARREVTAMLCLIDAVGRPRGNPLRELRVESSAPEGSRPAAMDWWSKSLLGARGSSAVTGADPLRSGGTNGASPVLAGLGELGGLSALVKWVALCDRVPHLLSVLDAHHHGFAIDARASILSLAVGWEHLAEASRGEAKEEAWKEIRDLLAPTEGGDGSFEKMIELCWYTYLEIKHVRLRKMTNNSIPAKDGRALGIASEFMYCTVLAAAFALAGIPIPGSLQGRLSAFPENGWTPEWHWVVAENPPQSSSSSSS